MTLDQLRASLREKHGALDALHAKAFAEGSAPEDLTALEAGLKDVEDVERKIDLAERAEAARAKAAKPADAPVVNPTALAPAEVARKLTPKEKVSILIKAAARSKMSGGMVNTMQAIDEAGFPDLAKDVDAATRKALNQGVSTDGGVLIPTVLSAEFIPLLRQQSVILSSGPRIIPLPRGNLTIPGMASGATAAYVGETQPIPTSQPTFKSVTLNLKKLAGIVPVSNELIVDSTFAIDTMVADDLVYEINNTGDSQMLRGVGSSTAPTGLLNLIPSGQKTAAYALTGTLAADIQGIIASLTSAKTRMRTNLVPPIKPTWVMSPRTAGYLSALVGPNSNFIFPSIQGDEPTLMNLPVKVSTHVPDNLGTGTNESEIYLIDFGHVYVGEGTQIVITTSMEATVVVASTPVSAFQNDLTLVRGIVRHDIDLRYLQAVEVITGVKWQ
ncbi:phage major capsid protein [Methylobacterium sp. JK268]